MRLAARMRSSSVSLALACGILYPGAPGFAQVSSLSLSTGTGGSGSLALSFGGGGTAPAGLQWTLVDPSSQNQAITATAGPAATAAGKTLSCASAPGFLTCVLSGLNTNPIVPGVVANIQLTPTTQGTAPSITINNTVAVDATGSALTVLAITGLTPPLQISGPASLGGISLGQSISGSLVVTGGVPPYTFSATGLPPGVTLNSISIAGTPAAPGIYSVGVTVTDTTNSTATTTIGFSVFGIVPVSLPPAVTSSPYSFYFTTAGGTPPYTWTLAGGSLPDGIGLGSQGAISGTPTTPGSWTFSARAADAVGASGVGTFSISVAPLALIITTLSPLASGMVTVDYPVQVITAAGGVGPYTFAVPQDTLPAGLTLSANGAISGTPTAAGNSGFTVTATDQNSQASTASFQIVVRPFSADLLTSAGSLSFSLAAGITVLPGTQALQVESTDVTKILSWSTAITPAATWLSVPAGGATGTTTPGSFNVALTSAALSLPASATPYQATILVSCLAPSPCAGNSQTIAVSLLISAVPSALTVLTPVLSFTASLTNLQPMMQGLGMQNTGGGSIAVTSVTCPPIWCKAGAVPSSLGAGIAGAIDITADPTGLNPGYYYTNLMITSSVGATTVPVTLSIPVNSSLALNSSGTQRAMPAGGVTAVSNQSFLVTVSGTAPVAWTATVLPGAPWLNLITTSGTSTGTTPGLVGYSINQSEAAALVPQTYYATIRVSSTNAANSPQDFQIVLNITAATAPQMPNPSPAGLVFLTSTGDESGNAAPQTVQVLASSITAVPYQASAATADGNSWLSVTPATGITSASSPAQSSITVSPAGLATGVYHGSVSYSLSAAAVPTVNVTLVIEPPQLATTLPGASTQPSCTPTQIIPTQTGLVNNFISRASMPTPIGIEVVDNCGNPVTNGQIVATFSNGDPPLALNLENPSLNLYCGTWTPRNVGSQVTVTVTANVLGFAAATAQISGSVVPTSAPVLTPNGTLHIFTPEVGAPLAPGTIVQIYGSGLARQTLPNTTVPLATSLAGTSVTIGGLQAPLFFVSAGQVNAQIPSELTPGQPYQVIVNNNGALTTPESIQSTAVSPGVASLPSGYANAQHGADGSAVTDASPAKPGEYIVIYLAGMGATSVPVASGAPAPSSPLAETINAPTVTLNSESVSVRFSGLTPGLAGLYQIDLQVPSDAPDGDLPLQVNQSGFQGSPVILAVHH
jgi:uncharacterized protein (TIGR03437 family)